MDYQSPYVLINLIVPWTEMIAIQVDIMFGKMVVGPIPQLVGILMEILMGMIVLVARVFRKM